LDLNPFPVVHPTFNWYCHGDVHWSMCPCINTEEDALE
jgi:hypothetical protein